MSQSTQLFDAIRQGDESAVKALLAADPALSAAKNNDGATAVLWSIYTRHAELAPLLLGAREPDFFEAAALGRTPRVRGLLSQRPDLLNAFSDDGFTALGLAIFFGHIETARHLVEAGADVNLPSNNAFGVFPLHSAVASGNLELVELLLAQGARPDCAELLTSTPLHSAAAQGNREMVERLVAAGADPKLKTKDGKTAAELARETKHEEIALYLEKKAKT